MDDVRPWVQRVGTHSVHACTSLRWASDGQLESTRSDNLLGTRCSEAWAGNQGPAPLALAPLNLIKPSYPDAYHAT